MAIELNYDDTATVERDGMTFTVRIERDDNMGAPWEEHDGHGPVSDWTSRDKRPGERVLSSDYRSKRFYDVAEATRIAKRDGWGLGDEAKATLAAKLGRAPTQGEITACAVEHDFDYLRRWCNDDWYWVGYVVEADGDEIDSCWGYASDDTEYMLECAEAAIDAHCAKAAKEQQEAAYWSERDTVTV